MIYAKLNMNTEVIKIDGETYCAYCGKKVKPDTEIDHYETTEYYHCDCEKALKEIWVKQEIKKSTDEYKQKLIQLENQFPSIEYKVEKKDVLCKIEHPSKNIKSKNK